MGGRERTDKYSETTGALLQKDWRMSGKAILKQPVSWTLCPLIFFHMGKKTEEKNKLPSQITPPSLPPFTTALFNLLIFSSTAD